MKTRPSTNTTDILTQKWVAKKGSKTDFIIVASATDGRTVFIPDPIAITSLSADIAGHLVKLHNDSLVDIKED